MVLLHAPDITLQFWLRVGSGGGGGGNWTTDIAVETSAASMEDEKIFLMDYGMLSRLIEEIEKIISVACKLERLHECEDDISCRNFIPYRHSNKNFDELLTLK
ncbi:unnamed protein product [Onchocerca ochengi]|uniref:Uncharacterized protein n=1 Tax=Onchocerca ochengi TaxID=42157 RepID=A0A182E7H4_ONCOC|nr:unnamed protein product [Onchocerca ochengi]